MLETLRIQNYALLDQVEIDFRPGFNVLTGETGAGKSILLGALNLVLGGRASADAVREGAERAVIEALFHVSPVSERLAGLLAAHDIPLEDDRLLLSRTIGADGRSRAYAGGNMVPVGVLASLGDELVDLHGQHEHQSLLKPDRQLDLLDGFAGLQAELRKVAEAVQRLRALERELGQLEADDRDRARQIEFMKFEMQEIDSASITPGEDEELKSRVNLISNAEHVHESTAKASAFLYENEDSSAVDLIGAAVHELDTISEVDPLFPKLSEQLSEIQETIRSICGELRGCTERLEFDPDELNELNQRLTLLQTLKRKYGQSLEQILVYRDRIAAEIAAYDQRDERIELLRKQLQTVREEAQAFAAALSKKRLSAATKLQKQVCTVLQDLGMKGAQFEIALETGELTARGLDRAEFLLAANAGERKKPLRQVASGGEISRVMLGVKAVFAGADAIPTLIFDEIDAGVGGAVARQVGEKLRQLASTHQVLCITHIPQIAALGNAHFHVSKQSDKGRTRTHIAPVDTEERVRELARLLDGTVSRVSIEHARELLKETA